MQRLNKQFKEIQQNSEQQQNYKVKQLESLLHWELNINGPKDTPYEGGVFKIDVKFPSEYPFKFPQVKFITPIYHPGVSGDKLCGDAIGQKQWKPNTKFQTIISNIINLLGSPTHVQDPVDCQAQQDVKNGTFANKAKEMTQKHAMGKQ